MLFLRCFGVMLFDLLIRGKEGSPLLTKGNLNYCSAAMLFMWKKQSIILQLNLQLQRISTRFSLFWPHLNVKMYILIVYKVRRVEIRLRSKKGNLENLNSQHQWGWSDFWKHAVIIYLTKRNPKCRRIVRTSKDLSAAFEISTVLLFGLCGQNEGYFKTQQ